MEHSQASPCPMLVFSPVLGVQTSNSLSQCLTTSLPSSNEGLFSLRTMMAAWLCRTPEV